MHFLQFLNLVTADGRVSSGDLFPSVSLVIKWAIVLIRVTMDTTVKVAASTFKSSQTKLLLTDATLLLLLLRRRRLLLLIIIISGDAGRRHFPLWLWRVRRGWHRRRGAGGGGGGGRFELDLVGLHQILHCIGHWRRRTVGHVACCNGLIGILALFLDFFLEANRAKSPLIRQTIESAVALA